MINKICHDAFRFDVVASCANLRFLQIDGKFASMVECSVKYLRSLTIYKRLPAILKLFSYILLDCFVSIKVAIYACYVFGKIVFGKIVWGKR